MNRIASALLVLTSCSFGQSFAVASIRLHKDLVQVVGTSVSGQRLGILKDVGLRLESQKQLMDVYVVDDVEKLSSN